MRGRDTLLYDALGNLAEERRAGGTSSEGVTHYSSDVIGRLRETQVLIDGTGAEQVDSTTYDVLDRVKQVVLQEFFGQAAEGAERRLAAKAVTPGV